MTPFQIEIIMYHNHSLAKFPRSTTPLYEQTVAWLVEDGILETDAQIPSDSKIRTTERGRAYCAMLCATPLPVRAWRDPRTDEAIEASAIGAI